MPSDTKWNFDWSGRMEQLEERLAMSADPLGGSFEHHAINDAPPALDHHTESTPDFWIDSTDREVLNDLGRQIDQALEEAHGQTGLLDVRADYGFTGIGQTVAVIDSGIAYDHFALGGGFGSNYRVVGGWDFTGENDADPYDDGPSGSHGSHVAGIVGGDSGNDTGVAPGVDLVALRVFDDAGAGYFSWVEDALTWVHDNRNSFENPITAINLSLGVSGWNSDTIPAWANLEDEFAQLEADGIFIAVSAGNSYSSFNTTGLSYPAASSYVIPVMSTDDSGLMSYFSQRHSRAIAAPGRWITSTVPDYAGNNNGIADDYATKSGTSMAAPYVAGASVIIREAMQFAGYTNITQDTIYDHMMATADSFFDSATNQSYSRLNVQAAVDALMPADDYGSDIASAYSLGTINNPMTMSGAIANLTDVDYFAFTAASTGTVTFEVTNMTHELTASWLVSGPQSLSTLSSTGDSVTVDVVAGQDYTLGFASGDGIGYYDFDVTAESTFTFTDWGSVEFTQLDGLSVTNDTWYRVEATSSGYLTVDSIFDGNGGQVGLEFYDSAMQLIDTGNAVNGTSRVDAYVSAGDELYIKVLGTNSDVDFRLTNLVSLDGTKVNVAGTSAADTFAFTVGTTHVVSVNGVAYNFASIAITDVNFNGGAGTDSITMTGTTGDETATLKVGDATLVGSGFTVKALNVENVSVFGGGGSDLAYIYDSAGDDFFVGRSNQTSLYGDGFTSLVTNFDLVYGFANNGGQDEATLYDSAGNDRFFGYSTYAYMSGDQFANYALGFDVVYAFSNNGGYDQASLFDSAGNDSFFGYSTYAYMRGDQFANYALGFDLVYAFASNGGYDQVSLFDSAGNDQFNGYSTYSYMRGDQFVNYAFGFDLVYAFSNNGGQDEATLHDSAGNDQFFGYATYAYMQGDQYRNYALGFEQVTAIASNGGQDEATLYDSAGNDQFFGYPTYAYMRGDQFINYALGFDQVSAFANNGGNDQASLFDSAGNDQFFGYATYSYMRGDQFTNYALGFDLVYAFAGNGGYDQASLFDSVGDDQFFGYSTYAYMRGEQFVNYAWGFDITYAFATNGGQDEANLFDSAGDDDLVVGTNYSYLYGDGFLNYAYGFENVNAYANNGGYDQASLLALQPGDSIYGRDNFMTHSNGASLRQAFDFDEISAEIGPAGGTDVDVESTDYVFNLIGNS